LVEGGSAVEVLGEKGASLGMLPFLLVTMVVTLYWKKTGSLHHVGFVAVGYAYLPSASGLKEALGSSVVER
jgi:hypothetical protein